MYSMRPLELVVFVCVLSVSVELITCVPRYVLSVLVLMCLLEHTLSPTDSGPGPGTCSSLASTGHWICQPVIVTCSLGPAVGWEPRIVSAKTVLLPEQKGWKTETAPFNVFKLTNSLSVKAGWWQAAKSPIPSTQAYTPCNTAWLSHTWAGKVASNGIKVLRNQSWLWFMNWVFVYQSVPSTSTAWGMCWDKSSPKAVSP